MAGHGGSAWLHLRPDVHSGTIDQVLHGVAMATGWRRFGDRLLILAQPGYVWHAGHVPLLGLHGGLGCRRTVAIVGGGHSSVRPLARVIGQHTPELRDWAPTIASLLGVGLPHADGHDLLIEPIAFG